MNARKFIAASSREALKLVRIELGEDAVILSNRKVPEGVEIVAMAGAELAHLSETNNTPDMAYQTVGEAITRCRAHLSVALQDRCGELIHLGG